MAFSRKCFLGNVYNSDSQSADTRRNIKKCIYFSPLGVNDHREILSQPQQQETPSLLSEVNFTNTPVVNLRRTQEAL